MWVARMTVEFKDNTMTVKAEMVKQIQAFLEEAGGELKDAIQRNSRVDTGQTKGSYKYKVISETNSATVQVGSDYENAIWEEFGTGEYALNGDGRKGGWYYKSKKDGKVYHTYGKKPKRPMYKAYISLKSKLIKRLETIMKG
ncbi:MAG: HK97 gp10 family phage protein [Bacteroides sp.]|nr:HK97 gp10 family phage protein [Bacteroides sp.]